MSLQLRLSLALTCVLLMTVAVGMSYLMINVRQTVAEELKTAVSISATLIEVLLRHNPVNDVDAVSRQLAEQFGVLGQKRHITITTSTKSDSIPSTELADPEGVPRWFINMVKPESGPLLRVIELGKGPQMLILQADPADEITESWREVRPLILMLLAFAITANLLVYFVLGRALRSLSNVSSAMRAVEDGVFDARVARVGVKDIDDIANRFNQMSERLQRSQQETRMLAERSLAIQEAERRRLAGELHDELGQSISAIKALAVSIQNMQATANSRAASSAAMIVEVSSDVYDRVRRMMAQLRPVVLDELGLRSALQNMIDDWNSHHEDTFCEFNVATSIPPLDDDVAINCYRIVQELLTNVAKHAQAEHVRIDVTTNQISEGDELSIVCADDGVGFNVDDTPRGLGLIGVYERVDAMRGIVSLATQIAGGTHVSISVPLKRKVTHA